MTTQGAPSSVAIVPALMGTFAGFLVGWLIATQSGASTGVRPTAVVTPASTQTASTGAAAPAAPPPLDAARVKALEQAAQESPSNAEVRIALGNLLMDAEKFDQAVPWYEAAMKLDPKNVEVSTDLGVCYYSTNQVDRALAQFSASLAIDPRHAKTLLNQGIVQAFGKQDLAAASESWNRLLALAPDSPEGQRARELLSGLTSAHPGIGTGRSNSR